MLPNLSGAADYKPRYSVHNRRSCTSKGLKIALAGRASTEPTLKPSIVHCTSQCGDLRMPLTLRTDHSPAWEDSLGFESP